TPVAPPLRLPSTHTNKMSSSNQSASSSSAAAKRSAKERKKPGRKPNPNAAEIRKDKNRMAQRNYRKRRENHIRGLEQQIVQLQKENEDMRTHFQSIVERQRQVIATLQTAATSASALSSSMAAAIGREPVASASASEHQRYLTLPPTHISSSATSTQSSPLVMHLHRFSDTLGPDLTDSEVAVQSHSDDPNIFSQHRQDVTMDEVISVPLQRPPPHRYQYAQAPSPAQQAALFDQIPLWAAMGATTARTSEAMTGTSPHMYHHPGSVTELTAPVPRGVVRAQLAPAPSHSTLGGTSPLPISPLPGASSLSSAAAAQSVDGRAAVAPTMPTNYLTGGARAVVTGGGSGGAHAAMGSVGSAAQFGFPWSSPAFQFSVQSTPPSSQPPNVLRLSSLPLTSEGTAISSAGTTVPTPATATSAADPTVSYETAFTGPSANFPFYPN
ncbi:hypothetical protein H4R34_001200, partial [Dimargaris verticillata]